MSKNEFNDHTLNSKQLARRIYDSVRGTGNERFCFILGSGASKSSGIPMGGELEYDWMETLMGETPFNGTYIDPEETRACAKKFWGDTSKFDRIVKHWEERKGSRTLSGDYYFDIFDLRQEVTQQNGQRLLEEILERDEVFPSYGYITLAKLLANGSGSNLVLTTNFDNLVERALYMYTSVFPTTINHEDLADYIDVPNLKRPLIGKIHRGIGFDPLNSSRETNTLSENWKKVLDDIFHIYTPIVIGYSGGDQSLMRYLEECSLRNGIYWCDLSIPDNEKIHNAVRNNRGRFVVINGFDDLMTEIGKQIFGDDLLLQNVTEELERRTNEYCGKLIESYHSFAGKSDTPAAAELKSKMDEEIAKRKKEKASTAMDGVLRALELAEQKDYNGAIENYTKVIELSPNNLIAYFNRGVAYRHKGEYDAAIRDYTKAIELDPKDADAYSNRGFAYAYKGEYDTAIVDLNKTIELDPKDADAHNNRGYVYAKMGRLEEALKDCNRAIELDPRNAEAYDSRGFTYEKMDKLKEALADYDKALKLNPDLQRAKANRERVLALLRKKKQ